MRNNLKKVVLASSLLAVTAVSSFAQATVADPATKITEVNDAFIAASAIAVAMLGFGLVMRAVRKFTKG